MDERAELPTWQAFRVELAYTEADIIAYDEVMTGKQRKAVSFWGQWGTTISAVAAGLAGAGIMTQAWNVYGPSKGLIAVLFFAVFWLGAWSPYMWGGQRQQALSTAKLRRDAYLQRHRDAVMFVTPRGIFMRGKGSRVFSHRSIFTHATIERGLLLLWTAQISAYAIPLRRLDAAQQKALLSLGQPQSAPSGPI